MGVWFSNRRSEFRRKNLGDSAEEANGTEGAEKNSNDGRILPREYEDRINALLDNKDTSTTKGKKSGLWCGNPRGKRSSKKRSST